MFLKHPMDRIPIRMTLYGALLGSLASGIMFALYFVSRTFDSTKLINGFTLGLPIGLVWGGLAGIACGVPMYFITQHFIKNQYSVTAYRIYVGYLTTAISGIIFLPAISGALFIAYFGQPIFLFGMFCTMAIAVYCSQVTITKYFRETDVRKQKVK